MGNWIGGLSLSDLNHPGHSDNIPMDCLELTWKLMSRETYKNENLVISPLSLSAVLAMLGAGYSEPSPKLDQLLEFAGCNSQTELVSEMSKTMSAFSGAGEQISFVNAAWIDKRHSFQPSHKKLLTDTFKSETPQTLDFVGKIPEAEAEINSWAARQTNGLIDSVILPGDIKPHLIKVILTNALYFKGIWSNPFRSCDRSREFHLLNGEKIKVPVMTKSNTYYMYAEYDDFKLLEVPYQSDRFCMQLILPRDKDGLNMVMDRMKSDSDSCLQLENTELDYVLLPKFKFSYRVDNLEQDLPFLGGVELGEMVEGMAMTGIRIVQQVGIEVDERGTEAAVVTVARLGPTSCNPVYRKEFVADHPFLFTIKDKTSDLVLFAGALLNPLA